LIGKIKFNDIDIRMCFNMKVEVVGPNEALIISGLMHSPPTMIVGGRALVNILSTSFS
jgi:hypothetical protein